FLVPGHADERQLWVYTDQSISTPIISPRTQLSYLSNPDGGAEFVIITHKRFANSAQQYATYRDTNSVNPMSAKVVYVDEIYDEFGYGSMTSLAIKNFCKYALDNWLTRPRYVMLWGKGRASPRVSNLSNYVPSWGEPANDNEYVSNFDRIDANFEPEVPIGRVSIYHDSEGLTYLKKIDAYEHAPYADWMKKVVFLGGGKENTEQARIREALVEQYRMEIEDDPIGGIAYYFQSLGNGVESNTEQTSEEIISDGVGLIHFFGHSGTNIFDVDILEANRYKNWGRPGLMVAFGCYGGNYIELQPSFGERFILEPERGSVGYLANSTAGFLQQLKEYGQEFYKNMTGPDYGRPIGDAIKNTIRDYAALRNAYANILTANHCKQVNYQGDPAVTMRFPQQPDLRIGEPDIFLTPENFSALDNAYDLNVIVHNDGRTFDDSFRVSVKHRLPSNTELNYEQVLYGPVRVIDTLVFPITNTAGPRMAGLNSYEVTVDALDSLAEAYETNNTVRHEELVQGNIPAILQPYKYAVVPDAEVTLSASTYIMSRTSNLSYTFEIDTVHTFDSPMKRGSGPIQGTATLAEWQIPFNLNSGQVYYWRVRLSDIQPNLWNESSFKYIPTKRGWAQSRPPQFFEDPTVNVEMSPLQMAWDFSLRTEQLHALIHSIGLKGLPEYFLGNFRSNGVPPDGVMFTTIDHRTLEPDIQNTPWGDWRFLAAPSGSAPDAIADMVATIAAMEDNDYFLLVTAADPSLELWQDGWLQSLEMVGVRYEDVKDVEAGDKMIVFGRKGAVPGTGLAIVEPNQPVGNLAPRHDLLIDLTTNYSEGTVQSTTIGPSDDWTDYQFDWKSMDAFLGDELQTRVYGIRRDESVELLMDDLAQGQHALSGIDAEVYPNLMLEATPRDIHHLTPPQLAEWEVYYMPAPDVAIAPTLTFSMPDTIQEGEIVHLSLAALNVSEYDMDSMLVRFYLQNADRSRFLLGSERYGPVTALQQMDFAYRFHSAGKGLEEGDVTLVVELNPDNDQVEQYHFNNFFFHPMYVKTDKVGPIMDVTFDGKHIMDGDIVSPSPEIVIELNDENAFLPVSVSDSTYRLWFGTERTFMLNSEVLVADNAEIEVVPAQLPDNKARLIFRPGQLEDDEYTLAVQGYDFKGNEAGKAEYIIHFNVVNEKAISEVLPYPNPFSTSARWVFTLTGNERPYQMDIQIYTITGRLVKTIDLLAEGDVHFGYNISDYAWDGRDEYGDLLANGVYLYKVNAKFRDRFGVNKRDEGLPENLFKNGFGKLYIMR
ncbi:MAG: C25 family cysteine peptidase, partial [Bacteroidota bacterium]